MWANRFRENSKKPSGLPHLRGSVSIPRGKRGWLMPLPVFSEFGRRRDPFLRLTIDIGESNKQGKLNDWDCKTGRVGNRCGGVWLLAQVRILKVFLNVKHVGVGQNQRYHFGVGVPPILEPILVVHWGYDSDFDPRPCLLFHAGQMVVKGSRCLSKYSVSTYQDVVHWTPAA